MTGKNTIKEQMNGWAEAGIPFLFIIDFELVKPLIFRLDEISPENILYSINGKSNYRGSSDEKPAISLLKYPEAYSHYLLKFNKVKEEIEAGNSYLLNLTCTTPVEINASLRDIFCRSSSKFKLWYKDQFVCFSPEPFVSITKGIIRSFPMKGTIDASIAGAEELILNDVKETAEHYTIVDLIRNDLNMVSHHVRVEKFRYAETIETSEKKLLQISSAISGEMAGNYRSRLGDIIYDLLPAGSVSGAPKKKTLEIIAATESSPRGYYTGVFGIYDGVDLTSSVMIRFIEKVNDKYFYHSGGGITIYSDPHSEYTEMIDKIYVPLI